jgi:hypothetical protein
MTVRNCFGLTALTLPLLLTGCSLIPMKRHLPVPRQPAKVMTAAPEELVDQLNHRWASFENLTAEVEINLTLTKPQEGLATDYPSCKGWIVMQKPEYLRVVGQLVGVRIFNMASDGKTFTVLIPPKGKAFEGPTSLTKKSDKQFENLRPGFFFDAMIVRGLDADDYFTETSDVETIEDAAKKHLYAMPEYILNITRHASNGGRRDKPVRVITFHRDDLLPSNQDSYDDEGNLVSQVSYFAYKDFGGHQFPTRVVIKRPLEGINITLMVDKVDENQKLPADEFTVKIPPDTQIKHLQ